MSNRFARGVAVLGACVLWAACSKGENAADTTMADTTSAAVAAPAPPALTDANIAAILDGANAADSSVGNLASTKGTSADVKDFGRMMMRDHHALRKAGQDLVAKLGVTPVLPAGDNSEAAAKTWYDSLNALPKGAAWDKAYIDHEVTYHEAVLQTATAALGAAQNQELKDLITKAAPNLQGHLDKAKSIQTKLNAVASTP